MLYTPRLEIDLDALRHNANQVKALAPKSRILAMIKANAYGHGAVDCARALTVADAFGVARLSEALVLRAAGIQKPIVVMCGLLDPSELAVYHKNNLDILVHQMDHLTMLEQADKGMHFSVWLKLDTGMHRLGFIPEDAPIAYQRLKACPAVQQPFKLMSHFAAPEKTELDLTPHQIASFVNMTQDWPEEKSFAKSAAIIGWPETHLDWVRPGLMLYGISPFGAKTAASLNLKPVMTARTFLVRVDQRKKGENLGYGGDIFCPEDMPIGIAAFGYADGYPRHLTRPAPIHVNGKECAVIGRVAMDLMMIDLRNAPEAKRGDPVLLWGNGLPIERISAAANTIPYTLTTVVNARLPRILITEN